MCRLRKTSLASVKPPPTPLVDAPAPAQGYAQDARHVVEVELRLGLQGIPPGADLLAPLPRGHCRLPGALRVNGPGAAHAKGRLAGHKQGTVLLRQAKKVSGAVWGEQVMD